MRSFAAIWLKVCSHRRKLGYYCCRQRALRTLVAGFLLGLCAIAVLVQVGMLPSLPWATDADSGNIPFDADAKRSAWQGRLPWLVADVATWKDDRVACITLTFDDGSWSAITGIEELLVHNRIHATYYIITSSLHIKPPEYADELRKLLSHGHEIGSHTHNHRALWDKALNRPINDIREQVEHSVASLRNTFGRDLGPSLTFSYPFGRGTHHDGIRTYLRQCGFAAARGTAQGMNSARSGDADLMRIKAFPLTSYTPAGSLKWYIERVVKNGRAGLDLTWCVFFGHGARLAPHTSDDDAGYEPMREPDLKELIRTIGEHVHAGSVWSATLRDAVAYIRSRDATVVTSNPVKLAQFDAAARAFCALLLSEAGERRRSLSEFVGVTTAEECAEQMRRRAQLGNLLLVDVATRYDGPAPPAPAPADDDGPAPADARDRRRRHGSEATPGASGDITVCASIFLDALEDDTTVLHDTLFEDIRSRSWFCEAVVNDDAFARSCSCRLQLDDTGTRHHDDGTQHVYQHGHRHGDLENAKVRCCFSQRAVAHGDGVTRARAFISSHSGHIN